MNDFKDILEEIKSRNEISEIISNYIQIKPSGTNYKGLCPFHGEKTPSFHINTSKQIFKCFGCGEGGDVISFIMKIENLDFMDAVKFLAEKSGININLNMDDDTKKRLEKINKIHEINTEAARFFYHQLMNTDNMAIKYIRKRGLDEKTIKNFGLGFAIDSWDGLKSHLTKKGYSLEELVECGLINHNQEKNRYYDKFRNRVIFPIFDYKNSIIGFGGRVLDDSLPKYLNSPDSIAFNKRLNLYGLNYARKNIGNTRELVLVEGYMDLISLFQYGVKNVVATLGTALTEGQANLIKKYADTVIIAYDSDQAGVKATLRAIDILENVNMSVKVIDMGEYKDPDEFIRANGLSSFIAAIENSSDSIKYKINVIYKKYNSNNREEMLKFLKEVVGLLKSIKSPLTLNYYIDYISMLSNTNSEIIRQELFGGKSSSNRKKSNFTPKKIQEINKFNAPVLTTNRITNIENGHLQIEVSLIKLLLASERARSIIYLKVNEDDFFDKNSKFIYNWVLMSENKGIIDTKELSSLSIDMDYLVKLDSVNLPEINFDEIDEIEKVINTFIRLKINFNIENLSKQQKILEDRYKSMDKNSPEAEEVSVEIMNLTMEIVSENKKIKTV